MKQTLWLLSLILVVTLTACAERIPVGTAVPGAPDVPRATPLPARPTAAQQAVDPQAAASASNERGAKVWTEQNCNLCHGDLAAGRSGPKLAKTALSAAAVAQVTRSGKGVMPAYPAAKLSDADLGALYAWLQTLKSE